MKRRILLAILLILSIPVLWRLNFERKAAFREMSGEQVILLAVIDHARLPLERARYVTDQWMVDQWPDNPLNLENPYLAISYSEDENGMRGSKNSTWVIKRPVDIYNPIEFQGRKIRLEEFGMFRLHHGAGVSHCELIAESGWYAPAMMWTSEKGWNYGFKFAGSREYTYGHKRDSSIPILGQ